MEKKAGFRASPAGGGYVNLSDDAEFILALRNAYPQLAAEIRRLRAWLKSIDEGARSGVGATYLANRTWAALQTEDWPSDQEKPR